MSEATYTYTPEQPGLVKTIAVLTLINGIVNIFWGLIATATVTASVILICLAPLAILPTILGVFEIIYATKLLSNPPQAVRPSTTIAILEALCILAGNVFSLVVGILSLVFYNDPAVKNYFAELNGTPLPVNIPPAAPAPSVSPQPAPLMEAEAPTEAAPEPSAAPKKPSQRKIAAEKTEADPKSETNEADPSEKA